MTTRKPRQPKPTTSVPPNPWHTPPPAPPAKPAPSTRRAQATLTRERIRQIEDQAMRKLRVRFRASGIKLDDIL